MPETTATAWNWSLIDSVQALARAADRLQRAAQQAALLRDGSEPERLALHSSPITAVHPYREPARTYQHHQPDRRAAEAVCRAYWDVAEVLEPQYEEATLALACGAHWALAEVLASRCPSQTQVTYCNTSTPAVDITELEGLDASAAAEIEAARQTLQRCLDARERAEEIAGQPTCSEHEASEMFDTMREAGGLAAAAHTYGQVCQSWLPAVIRGAIQTAAPVADSSPVRHCVDCDCTDDRACPGGCYWVSGTEDLCSVCAERRRTACSAAQS